MKRFYLKNQFAIWCALREHNVYVRLARVKQQSPFLCSLLLSLRMRGGPAFVLRKGSGFNLNNLISIVGPLREKEAKFYSCEIICGLEHLHAMHIVHLDLSLENVLIADLGHIFITDFDRAYEMSWEPTSWPQRTCLRPDHRRRVDISNVKHLDFYEDINWEEVMACKLEPHYHPSQIEARDPYGWGDLDPQDGLLLGAAYRKCKADKSKRAPPCRIDGYED
ncbi:unnamed protein product [Taenia asiatica]|uniref:Protein kinase domain-containing protein n=1 Tax=Taenia asiatica TaxID=60517 RepID=A0A3P6QIZ0_TAEAS|nr:unnamed protein product [Taenia asiatica]